MMTQQAVTGASGEAIAERYLRAKGYLPVERNWRCRAGEIDLVMLDGDILVFAEVKLRRSRTAGAAEESVSTAKGRRLLEAGEWYVSDHSEFADSFWRIDLVAITMNEDEPSRITHLQNAITTG